MITLITGAPGAGKTAALVSLLNELGKDRAIYANGIPDLTIPHEELQDVTSWPESVPDGSIIVIDEVQRVWRPRGPGQRVPADISALETHRHRGLDFYIITQAPRLVDTNVRALVGRHVHLRDIGILGRWWYEWPEISENCAASWKQAPIKKRYRLPKAAFGLYKSASVHIKPIRSIPWMVAVMLGALAVTGYLAWRSYGMISSKIAPLPVGVSAPGQQASGLDAIVNRKPTVELVAYDQSSFIPRISSKPESAPAYDHIRAIVAMPMVTGGYCIGDVCKCITNQGTNAGLSSNECKTWMLDPPFNPYRAPDVARSDERQSPTAGHPTPQAAVM